MSKHSNSLTLERMRDLRHKFPDPNAVLRFVKMFDLLDESLSNNGQLPTQWENAVRPIIMVKQHSEPGHIDDEEIGHHRRIAAEAVGLMCPLCGATSRSDEAGKFCSHATRDKSIYSSVHRSRVDHSPSRPTPRTDSSSSGRLVRGLCSTGST